MSFSSLSLLDNWLIDSIFQPICDWIGSSFGWSKKVLAGTFLVLSAASLMPFILWRMKMGDSPFITILLLIMNANQAARLFEEELKEDEDALGNLSIHRLRSAWLRKIEVVVVFIATIIFFLLVAIGGKPFPLHICSLLLWVLTDAVALYFLACNDLPKPLRKRLATSGS